MSSITYNPDVDKEFLKAFSPERQIFYCVPEKLYDTYLGNYPCLNELKNALGFKAVALWVMKQLKDLALFSGVRDKLDEQAFLETTKMILVTYGHLKITELMHFFWLFKTGMFGIFYGCIDPLKIMASLREFIPIRAEYIYKFSKEKAEMEKAKKDRIHTERKKKWLDFLKKLGIDKSENPDDIKEACEIFWLWQM